MQFSPKNSRLSACRYLQLFLLFFITSLVFTANAEAACPVDATNTYSASTTLTFSSISNKKICITGPATVVNFNSLLGTGGDIYVTNGAQANFTGSIAVSNMYLDVDGGGLITLSTGSFGNITALLHGGNIQSSGGNFTCRSIYVMPSSTLTHNSSSVETITTSAFYNLGNISFTQANSSVSNSELYNGAGGTFSFSVPLYSGSNGKRTSSVDMTGSSATALSAHTIVDDFNQYTLPNCSGRAAGATAITTFSAAATAVSADLAVVKTDGIATISAGSNTDYTITVSNNGPDASTVILTDPAATGLNTTAVVCGTTPGVCSTPPTIANLQAGFTTPSIPVGGTYQLKVSSTVTAANGTVANTATLTPPSSTIDPTSSNNSSTDTNTVTPGADLAVIKTNGVTTVNASSSTLYTITVTNNGPTASTARLTDPAVTGLSKTAVACSATPGVCVTPPTVASLQAGFLTPSIPSGGTYQINVTTTVTATSGSVANTATVAPPVGTIDPTPSNDSSTDTDTVTLVANFGVTKTDSIVNVNAGATTNYVINVTNSGPSASAAILTDPAVTGINVTAVACNATPGVCVTPPSITNLQNGFNTPSIPVGGTYQIRVTATITATSGTVANTAMVTPPSGTVDPTPANDSSTDTNNVIPVANLAVVKTDGSATASSGSSIVYTVTVTNNGPSPSTATLTDPAAAGLTKTAVACGTTPGVCITPPTVANLQAGFVTPTIPTGGTYQLNVTTTVTALSGNVTNTATVAVPSGTTDPTPANNTSADTNSVVLTADLAVVKTNGISAVSAGSSTVYTLTVTNNGPSAATARLTDPAVTGLNKTAVVCGTTPGVCSTPPTIANLQAGFVTPSIPSGGTYQLRVTATVTATSGSVANTATVTPPVGTTDPNNSNDSSTDTDTVTPVAPVTVQNLCDAQLRFVTTTSADPVNGLLDYTPIATTGLGVYENVGGLGVDLVLRATNQDGTPIVGGGFVLDASTSGLYNNFLPWRLEIEYYRTGTNQIVPASTANFTLSLEDFEAAEAIRISSTTNLAGTALGPINIRDDTSVIYNPGIASPGPSYSADGQTIMGFFPTGGGVQTGKWAKIRLQTNDYHKLTVMIDKLGGNNAVLRLCSPYASSADLDRSDAPASYTEAWHDYTPGILHLGSSVDFDDAAIMSMDASGDGADDDGVNIPNLIIGSTSYTIPTTNISALGSGTLHAWVDFNRDGVFSATEYKTVTVTNGVLSGNLVWSGISAGAAGSTFARFRLTTTALTDNAGTTGVDERASGGVANGEVEDYLVTVAATPVADDYSDAPSVLGVATHSIDSGLLLGATVTADNGAVQDADNASDDGITTFPALSTTDSSYAVNATVTNTIGSAATLHAWIDLDRNGMFDSDEHSSVAVPNGTNGGTVTLNWANLPGITLGASYARFRLTTDTLTAANASTVATDGEVEDYPLTINGSNSFAITGKVYHDVNVNGNDDSEKGLKNVTIVLYDTAANTCRSTRTAADGSYRFSQVAPAATNNYSVYEAAAETLPAPSICPPVEADPNSFLSTTANSLAVTVSNANVSGVDFGDVKLPQFTLEHSQAILPGSTVTYPHQFTTSAAGTVSFSLADLADPSNLSWEAGLFIDTNCNAVLDNGDLALTGSLAVSAGDTLCLLAKVLAPSNVSGGASYTLDVISSFTYGDGSLIPTPVEQTRTDLTRTHAGTPTHPVDGAGKLKLSKSVWNMTRNIDGDVALPGETLRYTIAYENIGNGSLDELIVYDRVPEFTQLVGASQQCGITPPELSACAPTATGETLEWSFVGQLPAGSQGEVFYDVIVE